MNSQEIMNKKRDYTKCSICSSSSLWSVGRQSYCYDCQGPAANKPRWANECHHLGKKANFAICFNCYQQVPIKDNHKDWSWIIEQQQKSTNNYEQPNK